MTDAQRRQHEAEFRAKAVHINYLIGSSRAYTEQRWLEVKARLSDQPAFRNYQDYEWMELLFSMEGMFRKEFDEMEAKREREFWGPQGPPLSRP